MAIVHETISVSAPWLGDGRQSVVLNSWIQKVDSKYFKVSKSDPGIVRLLTGHGVGATRQLAHTNIVELLMKEREAQRDALTERIELDGANAPIEDLGLDTPCAKRRKGASKGALPEIVSIVGPSFGDVAGIPMKVIMSEFPLQPLYVELLPDNVEYMHAFAIAQIDAGLVHRKAPGIEKPPEDKVPSPAKGVVWVWDRNCFRARYKDADGANRTKDFRVQEGESAAQSSAADAASLFAAVVKP